MSKHEQFTVQPSLSAEALSGLAARSNGIERYPVKDRESWLAMRGQDVTASAAGALFGVHEYQTPYGLWALKSGVISEDAEETPPMRRGRLLEPVALQFLAEERPSWKIERGAHYYRDPKSRIGATPDAYAIDPTRPGFGIVQIKTVEPGVFRKKWRSGEDHGTTEPPLWIAIQAIIEATLTGASWAVVAPMVIGFGIDLPVIDIPLNLGVMDELRPKVAAFWRLVESGKAPDPDYGRDASLIAKLYGADDGSVVDLRGNNRIIEILDRREALKASEAIGAAAEKDRKALDAEIIQLLGHAAFGTLSDGRIVEAKTVRRAAYQVKDSPYRTVKIKERKAS
jgi:hypothetical protein